MAKKTKIITFEDPDYGLIYLEVEKASKNKYGDAAGDDKEIPDEIKGKLAEVLGSLKNFGKGVLDTVSALKPSEVEVKTGLKLEFSEGKLIGVFARARAEFPFEVTLKWKLEDQKKEEKA